MHGQSDTDDPVHVRQSASKEPTCDSIIKETVMWIHIAV